MKKDDLLTKLIKCFYGVHSDWDPRINRLGIRVFVGYWLYMMIFLVVAVICLFFDYHQAASMFLVTTATATLVVIPYILLLSKVKRASSSKGYEAPRSELKRAKRNALVGALGNGIFYMVLLYAMGATLNLHDHTFRDSLFDANRLFGCFIAGLVYTILQHFLPISMSIPRKKIDNHLSQLVKTFPTICGSPSQSVKLSQQFAAARHNL